MAEYSDHLPSVTWFSGEEPESEGPPPGVKVAFIVRLILVALLAIVAAISVAYGFDL